MDETEEGDYTSIEWRECEQLQIYVICSMVSEEDANRCDLWF